MFLVRDVPDKNRDPLDGPVPILKEVYLPISSRPRRDGGKSIEIPAVIVSRLGFWYPRAWVIVSEANVQSWPNVLSCVGVMEDAVILEQDRCEFLGAAGGGPAYRALLASVGTLVDHGRLSGS